VYPDTRDNSDFTVFIGSLRQRYVTNQPTPYTRALFRRQQIFSQYKNWLRFMGSQFYNSVDYNSAFWPTGILSEMY
jgi:hypothetical protein